MSHRSPSEQVLFDLAGLYGALDARRRARGLSWQQAAHEIGTARSTIIRTAGDGVMEADGVLAMLRWLGASPERFVLPTRAGRSGAVPTGRCDTPLVHRLLDRRRRDRGMTWREVADELGHGVTPAMLTRLAAGGRMSIQLLVAAAAWLNCPIDSLTAVASP
jgi:transcriptional regulator with XRE-family HTH domain